MKNTLKTNYEGMGFVEALIAIIIVGVSSIVLMQIAADTMKEMIQNEAIDNMTQYAVEGSTMVQDIATQERLTGENVFPSNGGYCYLISVDADGRYFFVKQGGDEGETYITYVLSDVNARDQYKVTGEITSDGEGVGLFRIFCLDEAYTVGDQYAIVKVIVGQTTSDGTITNGSSVKDYTYFTVVNL